LPGSWNSSGALDNQRNPQNDILIMENVINCRNADLREMRKEVKSTKSP